MARCKKNGLLKPLSGPIGPKVAALAKSKPALVGKDIIAWQVSKSRDALLPHGQIAGPAYKIMTAWQLHSTLDRGR